MGITADTIGVDVVARINNLDSGLRQAEQKVDRSARRMDRSISRGLGFGGGGLGRMVMGYGLGQAVIGAVSLVEAGVNTYNMVLAKNAGKLKEAAEAGRAANEALKNLPFGLGHVASIIETYAARWIGLTARLKELDTRTAQLAMSNRLFNTYAGVEQQIRLASAKDEADRIRIQREIDRQNAEFERISLDSQGASSLDTKRLYEDRLKLADVEFKNRMNELKSVNKPIFDTFQTVLGTFKAAFRPAARQQIEPAKEDTAKKTEANTRKTAAILERALSQGGAIVAFGT